MSFLSPFRVAKSAISGPNSTPNKNKPETQGSLWFEGLTIFGSFSDVFVDEKSYFANLKSAGDQLESRLCLIPGCSRTWVVEGELKRLQGLQQSYRIADEMIIKKERERGLQVHSFIIS